MTVTICMFIFFMLLLLPFKCKAQDASSSEWISGIKINNARPYGMVGVIKTISSRFSLYNITDMGGNNVAFQSYVHYRFFTRSRHSLYINFGPNLELMTDSPDFENHDAFLSASSGLTYKFTSPGTASLHLGVVWLTPSGPPLPFKFFVGVSFPLHG